MLPLQRLQPIKACQKFTVTNLTPVNKTVLFFEMFLQKHNKAWKVCCRASNDLKKCYRKQAALDKSGNKFQITLYIAFLLMSA